MSEHTMPRLISFEYRPDYSSDLGSETMGHPAIDRQLDMLRDRVCSSAARPKAAAN